MKKISMYFLFVCLLLTGCSSSKTELPVENTEENQARLEINKIQLPLEPDCSVGSYLWMVTWFITPLICQWEIMVPIRI